MAGEAPATLRPSILAALAVGLVSALLGARYDLFRDELYFIVAGQHPAFGYVDQPPLVPLAAATLYKTGLGAFGLRIPVALAAGLLVFVATQFARLLNGGRTAVALSGLAAAIAPMLMGTASLLSTSSFDPLTWTVISYWLARAVRLGEDRPLVYAGLVAGVQLEIKYAVVFWLFGLGIGLLATPQRRVLARKACWIGVSLAAAIAAPSAIWQAANGLPFLELGRAAAGKNLEVPLGSFLLNQVLVMNPALAPLWIAGLVAPFIVRPLRDLRFIPIACLAVLVIVRLGHGKDYYLAPCYPALFAIGAVALEAWARERAWSRVVLGIGGGAALVISAILAPLAKPILPPDRIAGYMTAIGIAPQKQERSFAGSELPQLFADQLGWHDFADQFEAAWRQIPAPDRAATAILVDNYGEAAALDLYAGPRGLPPALSGHNQYFLWGLRGQNPRHVLVLTGNPEDLDGICTEVRRLGITRSQFAMAHENGKTIAWCRDLRPDLARRWSSLKNYS